MSPIQHYGKNFTKICQRINLMHINIGIKKVKRVEECTEDTEVHTLFQSIKTQPQTLLL